MERFSFHPQDFAFSFLSLLFEGVPFLLLGALASGLIEAFVPARWMTRLLPRSVFLATLLSGLLGLIFPMCECGIVPVIRRLIRKGLPASCAVTYMLSAPVISPVVIISTWAAFKGRNPEQMVLFRVALSFAVAVLVGLVVSRLRPQDYLAPEVIAESKPRRRAVSSALGRAPEPTAAAEVVTAETVSENPERAQALAELERDLRPTFAGRVRLAIARAAADFLDVAVYLVIGAALTSVFNTSVPREAVMPLALNPWLSVFTMMGLAFSLALCSTSDAFVAATFAATTAGSNDGFPFAALLAFLTLGPMLDVKLIFLYRLVFRPRFIAMLALGLVLLIGLVCVRLSGLT